MKEKNLIVLWTIFDLPSLKLYWWSFPRPQRKIWGVTLWVGETFRTSMWQLHPIWEYYQLPESGDFSPDLGFEAEKLLTTLNECWPLQQNYQGVGLQSPCHAPMFRAQDSHESAFSCNWLYATAIRGVFEAKKHLKSCDDLEMRKNFRIFM